MKKTALILALVFSAAAITSCGSDKKKTEDKKDSTAVTMKDKVDQYAMVELTADISHLTAKEKQIVSILFDVAEIMDGLHWQLAIGDKKAFLDTIKDPDTKRFAEINYGPWDRLGDNKPFMGSFGEKPLGAGFYPADMTKEEFEKLADKNKTSLYTVIQRNEDKSLKVVWYHEIFKEQLQKASDLLIKAAALAEDAGLKKYLELRAKALMTSDYYASDMAWMDMKTSNIDFVVGPIENYEDALYGYKAAFESFILIKDIEWSKKLERFAKLLPELQKQLPVEDKYKKEVPGADSDMNVYSAVFYGGDCNAGSKTIAINLPNDEKVQLSKGTRKLQLKNAMQAKFDKILLPIANILMDPSQRQYVKFDAFFHNVMFHEVAHGLGIKNTINGKGTVREVLQDMYSSIEEGKADITGLFLVTKLREMGEITDGDLKENYVSFVAGIFRSVRFGAASAHGKANMMCFKYFMDNGAISRNDKGFYVVDFNKMPSVVESLVKKILVLQGDGDYAAAKKWVETDGVIPADLQKDLDKLEANKIPVDIVFKQGKANLGL
ncbi:MAG: Zn-dependent hydrolase [Bacteroidetes bacterium GWF2_43_63]|nr:MAG: Zn-dependent hydrolase [Bacteroidetes bacterium GWE2_42_42]OFY54203.1 MAG: Zn-dependent hydrolase [Bacteroidetes bacterium GWF2_43_63]HBG69637.1 Zn-dependent hydrolase [Bacteroidales bacterium]HCB61471.1 Zn-dependent hydrolase [Bacteroidales bacterium]HCY22479.1 Zn-dependent hydrolase [Bacteroidales bacterium]